MGLTKLHLIVDCETNGLPITHYARYTEVSNWPRITQLSWGLYDDEGGRVRGSTDLIKPDGWTVPTGPFFVENNMSTERCQREGIPMPVALGQFIEAWSEAETLVAHNLAFDKPVIFAEMVRYKMRPPKKLKAYCTKLATEPILKLPGWQGKYKWPTLAEAHQFFFKCGFDGAHDAGADVEACAKVYFKCLERESFADIL